MRRNFVLDKRSSMANRKPWPILKPWASYDYGSRSATLLNIVPMVSLNKNENCRTILGCFELFQFSYTVSRTFNQW